MIPYEQEKSTSPSKNQQNYEDNYKTRKTRSQNRP